MTSENVSLEHPLVMAFKNPETDADVEFATASLRKVFPDVATHWRLIGGRKGAVSVSQSGYEKAAMSSRISLISKMILEKVSYS